MGVGWHMSLYERHCKQGIEEEEEKERLSSSKSHLVRFSRQRKAVPIRIKMGLSYLVEEDSMVYLGLLWTVSSISVETLMRRVSKPKSGWNPSKGSVLDYGVHRRTSPARSSEHAFCRLSSTVSKFGPQEGGPKRRSSRRWRVCADRARF